MTINLQDLKCAECGGTSLLRDYETGEIVCQSCGYVLSTTIVDRGPEWRAFDPEQREKLPRTGAPLSMALYDKGLSTTIGWRNRDASGKRLKPKDKAKVYRLRKWHRRSKISKSKHRNLAQALSVMSKIGYKLRIPQNVIETSAMIYRKAIKHKLIKGRTIHNVSTACLYMACRKCSVTRTLDEVAEASNLTRKEVARDYRFLYRALKPSVPPVNRHSLLSKFVSHLDLSGSTELLARKILQEAAEQRLTNGRAPSGITAACIYISGIINGERLTQGEVARSAQVTEVTIRNRYKEIIQKLDIGIMV